MGKASAEQFAAAGANVKKAEKFYAHFQPLIADDVANTIIYCTTRPAHVNIAEIMVYPTAQAAPTIVHRDGDAVTAMFD